MVEASHGVWSQAGNWALPEGPVWLEILNKYPDSNYYPYAMLQTGGLEYRDRFLQAINRFPDSPVVELLEYRVSCTAGNSAELIAYLNQLAIKVQHSKRPTTRAAIWGRAEGPKPPVGQDRQP
jgi:hypothetical protein